MWTPLAGYEDTHEAHPNGTIRNRATQKPIYVRVTKSGYLTTRIRGKDYRVHRLIAATFHPNPDNLPEVNHDDFVKANCAASNLEWCTREFNRAHAAAAGRNGGVEGRNQHQPHARPVIASHPLLGEFQYPSVREAERAGYVAKAIRDAIQRGWRHRGLNWRYVDEK